MYVTSVLLEASKTFCSIAVDMFQFALVLSYSFFIEKQIIGIIRIDINGS